MSAESIKSLLKSADAVCFDVDSTVIQEEAIDELAKHCGKFEEVTQLTSQAMGGAMDFRTSLSKRLGIINPSSSTIQNFLSSRPPKYSQGIKDLIERLHKQGTRVYLVTGGFRVIVEPIAKGLNIPIENIYANEILFDEEGNYKGFDHNCPTSKNGGKAEVVGLLKQKHNYKTVIMIGDGSTDLEAAPPADAFIGYGGVALRETVRSKAKYYVTDFQDLIKHLD
nr:PREDICTED: phosphoserine phosphatase [Bemisia tabaci]XP_018908972.1 PREDICTED: phosphoserine phosphatase [Bemisia tabaci]XP_018908973.1 PREDICTED: phosphoserine phosphatase [Bemisia tabaci]